jgi:mono/diheme cytochrome c family protein
MTRELRRQTPSGRAPQRTAKPWSLSVSVLAGALAALACVGGLPEPGTVDLALARADDPSIALADLQRGRAVYAQRCGNCHALRPPAERAPSAWPAEVARMQRAHAVHLSQEEEHDILSYLRAASARERQGGTGR